MNGERCFLKKVLVYSTSLSLPTCLLISEVQYVIHKASFQLFQLLPIST